MVTSFNYSLQKTTDFECLIDMYRSMASRNTTSSIKNTHRRIFFYMHFVRINNQGYCQANFPSFEGLVAQTYYVDAWATHENCKNLARII